jgi:hypothetical protein
MSRYWESIARLPRAAKWALCGLLVIALYFGVVDRTIDRINTLNGKADISEATLNKFAASGEPQKRALDTLKLGIRQFGDVDFPEDAAKRSVAFNKAVDRILADQRVIAKSRTKNAPLGQGPLTAKIGSDQRVERIVRDIEFDSTPEAFAAVVAALERSPVVASVSRVQVRQIESKDKSTRVVHATVTAEAWILSSKKGA